MSMQRYAAIGACLVAFACTDGGNAPTEPDLPAFAQTPGWHNDGTFLYDGGACVFVTSDSTPHPFQCGVLLVGVAPGTTTADLQPILTTVGGVVVRFVHDPLRPWLKVEVPPTTESAALPEFEKHERVRYVSLNFSGPATLS